MPSHRPAIQWLVSAAAAGTIVAMLGGPVARAASPTAGAAKTPDPRPDRFLAAWSDGSRTTGDEVRDWGQAEGRPQLSGRTLFGSEPALRWLLDTTIAPARQVQSRVELFGWDLVPGRVIGLRSGAESPGQRVGPHVVIAPEGTVARPKTPPRPGIRIDLRWIRRIVWQPVAACFTPGTLFSTDGRQLAFRALRLADDGVRLLGQDGLEEVSLGAIAELHFPDKDPWAAYFEQVAAIPPDGTARLMQCEMASGLRATSAADRCAAAGNAEDPQTWYHSIQPAWSLDVLWLAHRQVRVRRSFRPHQVPLSWIAPQETRRGVALGGAWRCRIDGGVQGGPLHSGGQVYQWGFGVHAPADLEFPLPDCARAVRTRFGLDRTAGDGGCARASVLLGPGQPKELYRSEPLVGSGRVVDTGPLAIAPRPNATLILRADPVYQGAPPGADPLDVRDAMDWLEPEVELNPAGLRVQLSRCAAR